MLAFDRSGKANAGQLLETAVLMELERRACETGYVVTPRGFEVDFLATEPRGRQTLIRVAADLTDKGVREREFRALADAFQPRRRPRGLLLTSTTSDALAAQREVPAGVTVRPAWAWLLDTAS